MTQEELAIIIAYYIDGYSHEEIGRAFGMNAAALQKRKSRIITRLRKECRLHM
ncbi:MULTISPECIES: sigma factor-like helix-turn-helix DNA-binding protein [Kurthia]|uniref:sigma factor-like helix-turn-helix DNA-binding protein n=1 Tax=Kurthia TaxID=1649 RepID=UPI003307B121